MCGTHLCFSSFNSRRLVMEKSSVLLKHGQPSRLQVKFPFGCLLNGVECHFKVMGVAVLKSSAVGSRRSYRDESDQRVSHRTEWESSSVDN